MSNNVIIYARTRTSVGSYWFVQRSDQMGCNLQTYLVFVNAFVGYCSRHAPRSAGVVQPAGQLEHAEQPPLRQHTIRPWQLQQATLDRPQVGR